MGSSGFRFGTLHPNILCIIDYWLRRAVGFCSCLKRRYPRCLFVHRRIAPQPSCTSPPCFSFDTVRGPGATRTPDESPWGRVACRCMDLSSNPRSVGALGAPPSSFVTTLTFLGLQVLSPAYRPVHSEPHDARPFSRGSMQAQILHPLRFAVPSTSICLLLCSLLRLSSPCLYHVAFALIFQKQCLLHSLCQCRRHLETHCAPV